MGMTCVREAGDMCQRHVCMSGGYRTWREGVRGRKEELYSVKHHC